MTLDALLHNRIDTFDPLEKKVITTAARINMSKGEHPRRT